MRNKKNLLDNHTTIKRNERMFGYCANCNEIMLAETLIEENKKLKEELNLLKDSIDTFKYKKNDKIIIVDNQSMIIGTIEYIFNDHIIVSINDGLQNKIMYHHQFNNKFFLIKDFDKALFYFKKFLD